MLAELDAGKLFARAEAQRHKAAKVRNLEKLADSVIRILKAASTTCRCVGFKCRCIGSKIVSLRAKKIHALILCALPILNLLQHNPYPTLVLSSTQLLPYLLPFPSHPSIFFSASIGTRRNAPFCRRATLNPRALIACCVRGTCGQSDCPVTNNLQSPN